MNLLVIEDDSELLRILRRGFTEEGIRMSEATSFLDGCVQAETSAADVILLDIMLPGGSGFDLCRRIRERGVTTPVLMLTARAAVDERVRGLEGGADDYLTKPFDFRELLARVRALARRPPAIDPERYEIEDLLVEMRGRRVKRGDRPIRLTAKEWDLLEFFVRHAGAVMDRASISTGVWDDGRDPLSNVLEVLIGRLRRKIDEGFPVKLIHTVRGTGYRFGP